MIAFKNISKTFATSAGKLIALNDVSLEVKKGEIYGVIGHSGAGKSTLIRCANLLEGATSGRVFIDGVDLTNLSEGKLMETRRKIGMIFQGFNLLKTANVYDNIAIPLKLTGVDKREIHERVGKYLSIVGLADKHKAFPPQLSGGQKQRVAIARALSHQPEILLSDEATSALDPETTESILELLLKINKEFGITILLITHEMKVIQRICDRVAVMDDGRIVEEGSVLEVYAGPKHPTTKKFINSMFPKDLPKELIEKEMNIGKVVTLSFVGEITSRPVLAEVAKKYNVYPNILSGNIIQLKNHQYGRLVVNLQGNGEAILDAVEDIRKIGVQVEEVKSNVIKSYSL